MSLNNSLADDVERHIFIILFFLIIGANDKDIPGIPNTFEEYIYLRIQELIVPLLIVWFGICARTIKLENME